jgi:hypothetical protein
MNAEEKPSARADWGSGTRRQIFTPHLHFLVSEGGMDGALFLGE